MLDRGACQAVQHLENMVNMRVGLLALLAAAVCAIPIPDDHEPSEILTAEATPTAAVRLHRVFVELGFPKGTS
jgi:hypothetical protein